MSSIFWAIWQHISVSALCRAMGKSQHPEAKLEDESEVKNEDEEAMWQEEEEAMWHHVATRQLRYLRSFLALAAYTNSS